VTCAAPIGWDDLLDYWSGDLDAAASADVEEHVFACERCAARLAEVESIAESVRRVTAAGRFRAAVAPSLVDLLAARGLRIRTYRPRLGETIPCGAARDDELLVVRAAVDLRGVTRLDLVACDEAWQPRERQVDVPFDRARGEVVLAERVDLPELASPQVFRIRLLAVDAGGERELGTFAMAHDPRGPPSPAPGGA
jgi:hypothetical protein